MSYFYDGLTSQGRQVIEMMCNCEFKDKSPEDALDYLDYIAENAENAQHWDTIGSYKSSSNPSHLHLVEACITLGKTMIFKPNLLH